MLTITPLSARGQSAQGADVLRYLVESEIAAREDAASTAYYAGKQDSGESPDFVANASRWLGSGAADLGLLPDGRVDVQIMTHLSRGYAPDGTTPLCQNAGEDQDWRGYTGADGQPLLDAEGRPRGRWVGGHRVGFDLTFSADKTVSVTFALADDAERQRIVQAHRAAVGAAMEYLEAQTETRRGKGGADYQGARLVASGHTHLGNRNFEPQLHEHVLLYNVTRGADGTWGTPEAEMLFAHQRAAGALYRAQLAHEMQRLGYGIEVEQERDAHGDPTGEVWTRVAGIDPQLAESLSSRRAEIEERMRTTGETAQEATLATRAEKEEPPYRELSAMWRDQIAALRSQGIAVPRDTAEIKTRGADVLRTVPDAEVLRETQQGDAVWSRHALLERVALAQAGRLDASGIQAETDRLLRDASVAECEPERMPERTREQDGNASRRYTAPRYTTREHLAHEDAVLLSATERSSDSHVRLDPERVADSVAAVEKKQGWNLSDEQREVVRWVCHDTGGLALVEGRAGTGKTASSRAWIQAFRDQGREVLGCAVGWDAARKLQTESGIESRSLAATLREIDRGKLHLDAHSVVVLDEAGMVGTTDLHALQRRVDRAGGKLVLVGDEQQLQSIEAGGLFGALSRTVGSRALTEIRRQHHAEDRTTVHEFYAAADREAETGARQVLDRFQAKERGATILDRLEQRGQISRWETRPKAVAALVADYRADAQAEPDKLILAGTRADCRALNEAVRTAKREAGEIVGDEARLTTADDGVVPVAVGDRVRFTRRDQALDVINGTYGQVLAVDGTGDEPRTVRIRLDQDAREVTLHDDVEQHLVHAYASTVHRAQGQGRESVYQLIHPGMADAQSSLVAFTRAQERFRAYGADLDLERIESRLGLDRRAWAAREAGVRTPERTPETPMPPLLTGIHIEGLNRER